jgi:hypothetical protein
VKEFDIANPKAKKMLLEILNKADKQLKDNVLQDVRRFLIFVKANFDKKGKKWEDIVLEFEWSYEENKIKNEIRNCNHSIKWAVEKAIFHRPA